MMLLFGVCTFACLVRYTLAMGYSSFYDGPPTLRFLERDNRGVDGDSNFGHVETSPGVPQDVNGGNIMVPVVQQQNSSAIMPSLLSAQLGQNAFQIQQFPSPNVQGYPAQPVPQEGSPVTQFVQSPQPLEQSPALQNVVATEQLEKVDSNLRGPSNGQKDPLMESLQEVEKQLTSALGAVKERLESIQELNKRPIHVDCGVTRVRFTCPKKKKEEDDDEDEQEGDEDEDEEE